MIGICYIQDFPDSDSLGRSIPRRHTHSVYGLCWTSPIFIGLYSISASPLLESGEPQRHLSMALSALSVRLLGELIVAHVHS